MLFSSRRLTSNFVQFGSSPQRSNQRSVRSGVVDRRTWISSKGSILFGFSSGAVNFKREESLMSSIGSAVVDNSGTMGWESKCVDSTISLDWIWYSSGRTWSWSSSSNLLVLCHRYTPENAMAEMMINSGLSVRTRRIFVSRARSIAIRWSLVRFPRWTVSNWWLTIFATRFLSVTALSNFRLHLFLCSWNLESTTKCFPWTFLGKQSFWASELKNRP